MTVDGKDNHQIERKVNKMQRTYILIGYDDDQIAYKQGKDTQQQVIERYKDYTALKEIWFYGPNGKLETIYKHK